MSKDLSSFVELVCLKHLLQGPAIYLNLDIPYSHCTAEKSNLYQVLEFHWFLALDSTHILRPKSSAYTKLFTFLYVRL